MLTSDSDPNLTMHHLNLPELYTERLRLRPPVIEDAQAIFEEYAADPDVARYMTWRPHATLESVTEFLRGQIEQCRAGEFFSWLVTKPPYDRPLGAIGGRYTKHSAMFGYVLGRRYWNRGIMSEAIPRVSEWVLNQPEIFRLCATVDPDNLASARVLEKSGFEREGLLRRWQVHPNVSPEPRDCLMYSRVR